MSDPKTVVAKLDAALFDISEQFDRAREAGDRALMDDLARSMQWYADAAYSVERRANNA
jgi:hypothetical protein